MPAGPVWLAVLRHRVTWVMELYCADIDALADKAGAQLLPPLRRARMERCRHAEGQIRCLTAGLMLRAVLGDCPDLAEGPHGKPYLPGGPQFNLSHSGRYVILGVSSHELGVDVERVAPWREQVARRCCTGPELEWLHAQTDERAFYQLWTAKESVMKATGLGFSLPPGQFSVLPVADGAHSVNGRSWFLHWLSLPEYEICTASAVPEAVNLIRLGRESLLG